MKRFLLISFLVGVLTLPILTYAQIVPCDGPNCRVCDFVQLGNNLIEWFVGIMSSICALMIVFAGFKMVMGAGNPGAISEAKEMITNTIVGFIILLASWLLVDTVLRMLVGDELPNFGPWNEIQCVAPPQQPAQPGQPGQGTSTTTTTATSTPSGICTDDAALMAQYRGSPVGAEDPGLRAMINCYLGDPQIAAATDNGQLYTVDRTSPRCSLTNGARVCGLSCQHSVNSCHYGRGSGQGARAVDFNARAGFTEVQLYNLIQVRRPSCGGVLNFETNHTHISMPGC